MPQYRTVTPKFDPISLQEYLAVPAAILKEYSEAEKDFNESQSKADMIVALLGDKNETNSDAWARVEAYRNNLKSISDAVADGGITNAELYRRAKGATKQYTEQILPLEAAVTNYQKASENRAKKDNGTLIGTPLTLNQFVANPLSQDNFVLGSDIQEEAAKAAAAIAARRIKESSQRINNGQYFRDIFEVGFTPKEIQDWLNNPESVPELNEIANEIATKYDRYDKNLLMPYIQRGVYTGITYDRKVTDKANLAYGATSSGTRTGRGTSKDLDLDDILNNRNLDVQRHVFSFGRTDLGKKRGNVVNIENNQVSGAKKGKDLLKSFGIPKQAYRNYYTDPHTGVTTKRYEDLTESEINRIMFTDDGKLRTPNDAKTMAAALGAKLKMSAYEKAYQQIIDLGYDPNTVFKRDTEVSPIDYSLNNAYSGNADNASKPLKYETIRKSFENHLDKLLDTNEALKTNAAYNTIDLRFSSDAISDVIARSGYHDWTTFEGVTKNNDGTLVPKQGKNRDKVGITHAIAAAKQSGSKPSLHYIPITNTFVLELHDKNNHMYMIPGEKLDQNNLEYYKPDWDDKVNDYNQLLSELEDAYEEYQYNPTEENKLRVLQLQKDLNDRQFAVQMYPDLVGSSILNNVVDRANSRNPNTESRAKINNKIYTR